MIKAVSGICAKWGIEFRVAAVQTNVEIDRLGRNDFPPATILECQLMAKLAGVLISRWNQLGVSTEQALKVFFTGFVARLSDLRNVRWIDDEHVAFYRLIIINNVVDRKREI